MMYFKLLDDKNFDEIIKSDGKSHYSYYFGVEKWVPSGIMVRYQWPGEDNFGEYEIISEEGAFEILNAQRFKFEQLLILAKTIATEAHKGQYDKSGNPYIAHLISVAESLESAEHKIVALLNGVLDDSLITVDDLKQYGFTKRIVGSVEILTKTASQSHEEYLSLIRTNGNAWHVKIAEIRHNMDMSHIPNLSEDDYANIEKYRKDLIHLDAPNQD